VDGLAVLSWGLNAFGWFFIAYSLLINTSFLVLTLLAVADFWAYLRRVDFAAYDETFSEPLTPGISILMPAYNESAGIVESVQAMTALRYPDFEVVVIDDGSKDDTSEQLISAFDMVEVPVVVPTDITTKGHVTATYLSRRGANNVLLVRKTNGGKADALQVVEYVRAFLIGRTGWSRIGGLLIISGAFGVFRKDVLLQLGGLATDCIGEDAELVVRLHRWIGDNHLDGRVVFVAEPVAWTEAPEDRAVLRKQRRRWHRGLTEILSKHKGMVLRPRYGMVGMVSMPWFVAFELLAPFVEVFGVVFLAVTLVLMSLDGLGLTHLQLVNQDVIWVLLAVSLLYAVVLTLAALVIEELSFRRYRGLRDLAIAIWASLEENIGYRQVNAWWRMGGSLEAWRKTRHDWGDMQRRGLGKT
jgi:cellulose synthase/poly-beta-1,6-N-acetylglucosamine synthase-like glycosyltransferase